jgi:catechol 2,3-dioxygenase-like lactoylglutathione lyase family enzyme
MPIPGVSRVDHIGLTVPDLEQAREFFVEVLGCEYLFELGPLRDDQGEWMREHLNVDPRAVVPRIHFYRLGTQAIFEVFEYEAPDQRALPPRNSDIGGHHIALYVEDLDAAVADLRRRGLTVLGEPTASRRATLGQRWVYFLAPWGLQCELVSYPEGRAFERDPAAFG